MTVSGDIERRKSAEAALKKLSTEIWLTRKELFGGKPTHWQRRLLERLEHQKIVLSRKGRNDQLAPPHRGAAKRYILTDEFRLNQIMEDEESLLMLVFPSYKGETQQRYRDSDLPPSVDNATSPSEEPDEFSDLEIQHAQLKLLMSIARSNNDLHAELIKQKEEVAKLAEYVNRQTKAFNALSLNLRDAVTELVEYKNTAKGILRELKGEE